MMENKENMSDRAYKEIMVNFQIKKLSASYLSNFIFSLRSYST